MANEQLKFRKGLYGKLPADKVAGTIYVTTDEKAMYVDVSNTERIRLGQIIDYKNTLDWKKKAKPPYSAEAFYYLQEENALLKYTGDGTNHSWKQINYVADIKEDIEELVGDVGTLKTTVSGIEDTIGEATSDPDATSSDDTLFERLGDIRTKLTAVTGTANQNAADIEALEKRVETNEGDIDKLEKRASDLETDVSNAKTNIATNASDIDKLEVRMGTAEGNITGLRTDLGTNDKTGTTAFTRIAALENELDATTVGVKARLTAVEKKATDNATNIGLNTTAISQNKAAIESNDADIKALQDAIGSGTGLTSRIETLEGDMSTAKKDITTMKGQISAHDTKLGEHETNLSTLNTFKDTTTTTLGTINGTLKTHGEKIGALEQRAGQIEAAATQLTGRVGTLETKMTTAQGDITNLKNTTGTHTNQIANLQDTKADKTALNQAITDLQKEIDDEIRAANAMNYIGSVKSTNELPYGSSQKWTSAKIGDTFVVSQSTGDYHAGDLLVAYSTTGVEQADGTIGAANIAWNHVNTGYIADHNPTMVTKENEIRLTSFTGTPESGDLGKVAFVADAATSATVTVANNTVTVGMAWEDFT